MRNLKSKLEIPALQVGFTLIEILLVISITGILFGLTTIGLIKAQSTTSVRASEEMLIADLKSQQAKAMNGTDNAGSFGVHFSSNNTYTLFQGVNFDPDSPANSPVSVDGNISISGNDIIFLPVSGAVKDFLETAVPTIIVTNATGSEQKTIKLNRYGVITQD